MAFNQQLTHKQKYKKEMHKNNLDQNTLYLSSSELEEIREYT
jgi:hypothetical protein